MRASSKIIVHEPCTHARLLLNGIPSIQRLTSHSQCCVDAVLERGLAALVRDAQVPVLIGGSGSHAAALESAGAVVLGHGVDAAPALIDELPGAPRPVPA